MEGFRGGEQGVHTGAGRVSQGEGGRWGLNIFFGAEMSTKLGRAQIGALKWGLQANRL